MPWKDKDTFETEKWHYIEAANNSGKRSGDIQLIVIHSGETQEGEDSAIGMGNWFASGKTIGSTHAGVDGGTKEPHTVQYVWDSLVAHGAGGGNHQGIHLEQAGRARQSREEWLDDYSRRVIDRAGNVVAQWAIKYNIPLRWLTVAEVRRGVKGICTHHDITLAFGKSTHTDPGPHYPKDVLLKEAQKWYRHHMSQHPGFNQPDDEPDFKVVAMYDADAPVDEGMALLYGDQNALKPLVWPSGGITFETAFLIGSVADKERQIQQYIESNGFESNTIVLKGGTRIETAKVVGDALERGYRNHPNVAY